jgi:site-specific recombinase XerD
MGFILSQLLGHPYISQCYTHLTPETLRQARRRQLF